MIFDWALRARSDYAWWEEHKPAYAGRVCALLDDIEKAPFSGLGKPEPLRYEWAGYWSRRISAEHRLVYRISGKRGAEICFIAQCRYHYAKK
jgi:toxin YoeB